MRITFDNTHPNIDKVTTTYSNTRTQESVKTGAYTADISGTVMDNNAYKVQGRTAEDVMQEAQGTDVMAQHNYMAVMSNSMSTEDFSKMLREGVDPNDMDVETVVTIVDRIKAELMKSGVSVAGYTDNIDNETLTQIVGSESLARQITDAYTANDIPVTEENVEAAVNAMDEALQLTTPTDGELKYLVNNGMESTIENLYMAEHSGAIDADRQGRGYYQENTGYYAKKADSIDFEKLLPQIEKIITEAGMEVNEDSVKQAKWIIEKGIPLTAQNISCLDENSKIDFPLKQEDVMAVVAAALADGKNPIQANLTHTKSKYREAAELSHNINNKINDWLQDDSISLTARRQLEEARLRMTAEVNVRLVESGFSIDTAEMEALVDALKKAEEKQAEMMFPGQSSNQAVGSYELYNDAINKTALLPGLPAATIGKLIFEEKLSINVDNLVSAGTKLEAEYQKAGQSYETLMTSPRKDMGDSIRKAFANVDDILTDIGMELSSENQRAVRILAYNNIPIIAGNIEQVRAADRKVQRVIDKMTPASTLQMIREGINPLTADMSELEQYFNNKSDEPQQEMETYSRYLYNLEQNKEITPEERDAYIGVYRMLRQIEKSDGAVIGSVLKAQSDLNFKQLLTAARTAKKAGMNILVDESFGGLEELKGEGPMIDEQISNIDTIRSLKNVEKEVIDTLNKLDLPVTANYVMAVAALNESANPLFSYIKEQLSKIDNSKDAEKKSDNEETSFDGISDKLTEALTGKEDMQKAYKEFEAQVTGYLKENLYNPGQTSLDVKAIKSACLQMSVASKMADEETYELPVMLKDDVAAIRLTIRHSSEANGQAAITLDNETYGKIQAHIQVKQDEVTGYIIGKDNISERLEDIKANLLSEFNEKGFKINDFKVVSGEGRIPFKNLDEGENKTLARTIYEASKIVIKAISDIL